MQFAAIIFDMDGLVVDTETIAKITWQQAIREFEYTISETDYLAIIGRKIPDIRNHFKNLFGADFPYEAVSARKGELAAAHIDAHGIAVKPGLHELIDWLDARSIPKAVASSTFRNGVMMRLRVTGLTDRFPLIVSGDDVKHGKPAPDIFLKASEMLGLPPADCLVLEDSNPGIEAAHAAGMPAIMVPDLLIPTEQCRQWALKILPSLVDVQAFLKSENGSDSNG
ncbi:HAD family phosphatase [candidate division KSB1 bacterium]|nr:HAD family phosphatase [candidate division KSB1 bacterium]